MDERGCDMHAGLMDGLYGWMDGWMCQTVLLVLDGWTDGTVKGRLVYVMDGWDCDRQIGL